MALPQLIRPQVEAQPTLETAIWFLQLRWVAVVGQLVTMAVVTGAMKIELPAVRELLVLISITALTNSAFWFWLRQQYHSGLGEKDALPNSQIVPCLLVVDILVLSGMLYASAGIANPFCLFYFVNIAVAAAIVTPVWAWTVWGTTVAGVTYLLYRSLPIDTLSSTSALATTNAEGEFWTVPKLGFLVSFAACSGVITYFITVLTGELREREKAMQEAEDARVRNRQLEGLTTLAAGAAHELATPLTTIAVVAKELSRSLDKQNAPESTKQDVDLIRSELDQCRQILDRMTSAAGEAAGERLRSIDLRDFFEETLLGIRNVHRVRVAIARDATEVENLLPVQAAAQAIRNLLQNALDASSDDALVELSAKISESCWQIRVVDQGHGMDAHVLERIGEPFFTTKEPGRGMGMGLYLTQNVIRRLNGSLTFDSEPGAGTTAEVMLPTKRD